MAAAGAPTAPAGHEPLVSIRGIHKTYEMDDGSKVVALQDASLEVADKEFVSLIGPSGCGKSTMLSIVAGLLAPTSGEVLIDGHPPLRARQAREIGIVFQQPVLLPWRTVRDNIALLLEVSGQRDARADQRIDDLLEMIGVREFANRYPHQLSGGMKHRVAIARALCLDPLLLLMDEPFAALDEFTRHTMNIELLKIWSQRRKTIIFVTHNIAEAVFMSDRVIAMSPRPGRIVEDFLIDLPRPRRSVVRYTREFNDHVVHLQRMLETDSLGVEGRDGA
jgi:NitT/TauT family transport system ATP-binding protein